MGKGLLSLGFTKEMIVLDLVISVHFFIFLFEFRSNSRSHTTRYLRRWLIPIRRQADKEHFCSEPKVTSAS